MEPLDPDEASGEVARAVTQEELRCVTQEELPGVEVSATPYGLPPPLLPLPLLPPPPLLLLLPLLLPLRRKSKFDQCKR